LLTLGLDRSLRAIERWVPVGETRSPVVGRDAERAVARAFRVQPWLPARCLVRSLVQLTLHRHDGVSATLVVGVRRADGGEVEAHAWVEHPSAACDAGFEPIFRKDAL
jgi:hypothetical protein